MSKLFRLSVIFLLGGLFTGCPGKLSIEYRTIESVFVLLFSFDENGVFPHTESFSKEELGIGIWPDSITDRYELAQSFSLVRSAYAMEPSVTTIYTNAIDSVRVYTIFDFDDEHLAGSCVNDILLFLDDMGDTHEGNIEEQSGVYLNFKFTAVPQNDSLQFEVRGSLSGENDFQLFTGLLVFE